MSKKKKLPFRFWDPDVMAFGRVVPPEQLKRQRQRHEELERAKNEEHAQQSQEPLELDNNAG